ncbi:MAG: hypothetical protein IPO08_22010 [Xanthomonadales bacterium]|nr:hypothetical protein [Xanthomonadales bacterium]
MVDIHPDAFTKGWQEKIRQARKSDSWLQRGSILLSPDEALRMVQNRTQTLTDEKFDLVFARNVEAVLIDDVTKAVTRLTEFRRARLGLEVA